MKPGSYVYTVLLGLDRFAAAIWFNRADITVSSLCWAARCAPHDPTAATAIALLRLNRPQKFFLVHCGTFLEWLQSNHCANARLTDLRTAEETRNLLGVYDKC